MRKDWTAMEQFSFDRMPLMFRVHATPVIVALLYGVLAYGARCYLIGAAFVKDERSKRIVSRFAVLHNAFLCLVSFAISSLMLFRYIVEGEPPVKKSLCMPPDVERSGSLFLCASIFYMVKYLELLDTAILLAKGHPPPIVHLLHHAVVLPMAHMWVAHPTSTMPIGVALNSSVHVPMYFYYTLSQLGTKPRWGVVITRIQIAQFTIGILCGSVAAYMHIYSPGKGCAGMGSLVYQNTFTAILLVRFSLCLPSVAVHLSEHFLKVDHEAHLLHNIVHVHVSPQKETERKVCKEVRIQKQVTMLLLRESS